MMPTTKNGLNALTCISALQKAIRRGLEREAMEFACELLHTSTAFHSMVLNRVEVIVHEDIDVIAAPHVVPFVAAAVAQSKARYGKHVGEARLIVGNVIRLLCRSPKSPRWMPLRCGRRTAVDARRLHAGDTGLRARHAHHEGQGDGPWP
jgi:replication-associated recombination protein RarA